MRRLLPQLDALQAALNGQITGTPRLSIRPADVDAFVRAIKRKASFASRHLALLEGIRWEVVADLGSRADADTAPMRLSVFLKDAELILGHPTAVTDHVYMAFDGLTAALVNITDTFGRLMNKAYALQLDERGATLLAVKTKCSAGSSLGIVLHDPQYSDWLRKVREMRGRCQHADVEEVLIRSAAPYAVHTQPYVDLCYDWNTPPQAVPLIGYAQVAMTEAEKCMLAVISAVLKSPSNPMA